LIPRADAEDLPAIIVKGRHRGLPLQLQLPQAVLMWDTLRFCLDRSEKAP
jgi:hypothetical protein